MDLHTMDVLAHICHASSSTLDRSHAWMQMRVESRASDPWEAGGVDIGSLDTPGSDIHAPRTDVVHAAALDRAIEAELLDTQPTCIELMHLLGSK